jgi:hypothetical protein
MITRWYRLQAITLRNYMAVVPIYLVNHGKGCNIAVGPSDRDG